MNCLDHLLTCAVVADGTARGGNAVRKHGLGHGDAGPERVKKLVLRHHSTTMPEEVREHVEDLGLDLDYLSLPAELEQLLVYLALTEGVNHLGDRTTLAAAWGGDGIGTDEARNESPREVSRVQGRADGGELTGHSKTSPGH